MKELKPPLKHNKICDNCHGNGYITVIDKHNKTNVFNSVESKINEHTIKSVFSNMFESKINGNTIKPMVFYIFEYQIHENTIKPVF